MDEDRISLDEVENCQDMLLDFAESVKRGDRRIRKSDFLGSLKPTIMQLTNQGISYGDICALLKLKGIGITVKQLKTVLALEAEGPTKRGRPPKNDPEPQADKPSQISGKKTEAKTIGHTPPPDSDDL